MDEPLQTSYEIASEGHWVETVKVASSQILVRAVILQHVVDNLQDRMSNRNTGSLLASSGCQASEAGTQKAIFCMASRLSRQY